MYKTNRQNHDFQIAYFLAGSCHTPDGAYALLCDQLDDRKLALKAAEAGALRETATRMRIARRMASEDEAEVIEAQADLAEIEMHQELTAKNVAAAEAEVAYIQSCMDKLEPLRQYAHLPLAQAHEAAQQEEWKQELILRAENYLLTTGTISTDHFATMRMHPEFVTAIMPAIQATRQLMQSETGQMQLLSKKPMAQLVGFEQLLLN
jgi:hypothetical protein